MKHKPFITSVVVGLSLIATTCGCILPSSAAARFFQVDCTVDAGGAGPCSHSELAGRAATYNNSGGQANPKPIDFRNKSITVTYINPPYPKAPNIDEVSFFLNSSQQPLLKIGPLVPQYTPLGTNIHTGEQLVSDGTARVKYSGAEHGTLTKVSIKATPTQMRCEITLLINISRDQPQII